ncbi:MAG: ferredoxin-thioredoxin reductase catalytic domain-containing protein [Spirochaetales bacterium]
MTNSEIEQTRLFVERVAEHNGWKVNPDTLFVQTLLEGLTTNRSRFGYYLCPCRETAGSRDKDRDVICPCVYSAADIAEYGHCYCALFFSQEFYISGKPYNPIPERRPEELIP